MPIHVHLAWQNDLPAVVEILNHAIRELDATFETRELSLEDFVGTDMPLTVLVAEEDGVIVGWASLTQSHGSSGWAHTAEDSVYVHHAHHGRGIGTLLLQSLLPIARARGYHAIIAMITEGNEASIALHRKFGFTDAGILREVGRKFDRWLDVRLMQVMIPPK